MFDPHFSSRDKRKKLNHTEVSVFLPHLLTHAKHKTLSRPNRNRTETQSKVLALAKVGVSTEVQTTTTTTKMEGKREAKSRVARGVANVRQARNRNIVMYLPPPLILTLPLLQRLL